VAGYLVKVSMCFPHGKGVFRCSLRALVGGIMLIVERLTH
jgi:hypothetical protein